LKEARGLPRKENAPIKKKKPTAKEIKDEVLEPSQNRVKRQLIFHTREKKEPPPRKKGHA